MIAALMALLRYRRIILAVVLVLLLLIAQCSARDKDNNACGPPPGSVGGLVYPVDPSTPISSGYGPRDGGFHHGVDFGVPQGTPVYALADGTVTAAQDQGVQGFGGWVVLSHVIDGRPMSSVYGHIDPGGVHVEVGQQVRAGDVIASSGNAGESSGPHLHFELHDSPDRIRQSNPVDPTPLLDRIKNGETTSDNADSDQRAATATPRSEAVDRNAVQVIEVGRAAGASDEAIVIALAVGLVESEMLNLASEAVPESKLYPNDGVAPGDADSVGVFQQRPSQGWGAVDDLMDVRHQADTFFQRLLASDWQHKSFTEAAADIQNPRKDLRGKYGAREDEARELFARLAGHAAAGGRGCSPTPTTPPVPEGGDGDTIVAAARAQIGRPYLWAGGNESGPTGDPPGFDCSGLTLYAVHAGTGLQLPHYTGDSRQPGQFQQGQAVAFTPATEAKPADLSQAQPGDLVFFGAGTDADHVGIYTGTVNGVAMMVHAPDDGTSVVEVPVTDGGELIGVRRFTTANPKSDTATGDSAARRTEIP
ncbi:peptidoglycan DD-metalloendopeptidase family protein [Nocardia wallacei]|uniref:peptidoglycan DD-metalloendopeptidase family protein n=1 Tax=Nocardia wallacei TaxID=480035 RepID=UPI002455D8E7|nr:peptidoglycan DD-metalloendopeptidase family protein [Nocardia wallacei]